MSDKFVSCDRFIRSKVLPPPIGSIMFNFHDGKVVITGDMTVISGKDCEVVIRGNFVSISGSIDHAVEMHCSIHREIEEIKGHCAEPEPVMIVEPLRFIGEGRS